jgi:ComF family protein
MADLMNEAIPPPPGAVLVPVPLTRRREAERGFNQSLLIAQELGALWEARVVDTLERVREAPPQRGASATDRARQVAAAFGVRPGLPVPAAVWIVDDVHTTGATLAACARALRGGGARQVGAVCFARAVSR